MADLEAYFLMSSLVVKWIKKVKEAGTEFVAARNLSPVQTKVCAWGRKSMSVSKICKPVIPAIGSLAVDLGPLKYRYIAPNWWKYFSAPMR